MWLYATLNPCWPDESLQNKPSCLKPFHLNLVYICCIIQNLIDGLDWTAASQFSCLVHAIQENFQANVQSSPETRQGGEGVQSGLGTMPHREILDEMLAHILWQQAPIGWKLFYLSIFLSCFSNTEHYLHITGQNNP